MNSRLWRIIAISAAAMCATAPVRAIAAPTEEVNALLVRIADEYVKDRTYRITNEHYAHSAGNRLTGAPTTREFAARIASEATELDAFRNRYVGLGGGYSRSEVSLKVAALDIQDDKATLKVEEATKLFYQRTVHAEAPQSSNYHIAHVIKFVKNSGWRLADDQIDIPAGVPGYPAYTNAGRGPSVREASERSKYPPLSSATATTMSIGGASVSIDSGVKAYAYDYQAMVDYARKWAHDRNPEYRPFSQDCTNFVSQALYAGGWQQTNSPDWYHFRPTGSSTFYFSRSWTVAHDWYYYALRDSKRTTVLQYFQQLLLADVLQADWFDDAEAPHPDGYIDHTMIVTQRFSSDVNDIKLSYHTNDQLDRALSEILAEIPPTSDRAYYYGHRT
ncbi:amidase domain-containing protein [Lentzea sp. NPDC004789]